MKNKMIESFNKRESQDRERLGQFSFLKKYIKKYKTYTATMRWLLPMVIIVNLALVGIYLDIYINSNEVLHLVTSILWSLATILWIIVTVLNYTFYFSFIDNKLVSWKKELEDIKIHK